MKHQPVLALICLLVFAGCATDQPPRDADSLIGSWTIEYINDRPVIDNGPVFLSFHEDEHLSGNASCNQLMGIYTLSGTQLSFGKIATTRMMCVEALMIQETRLLESLERVTTFEMHDGRLILQDINGQRLLKSSPRPSQP